MLFYILFDYKIQIRNMIGKKNSFLGAILFFISSLFLLRTNSWCLKQTFAQTDQINSIDFSADGSKFVTTSNSRNTIVWDAHTLARLHVYNINVNVNNAKFSKTNSMIAIGYSQNNVLFLNANNYAPITNINTGHGVVFEVDWNWNTSFFTTCGSDERLRTWNVSGTTFSFYRSEDESSDVLACRIARNSARIARGTVSSRCIIDNFDFNSSTASNRGKSGQIKAVAWNDKTTRVMFGSSAKKLNYHDRSGDIVSFFNEYTVPTTVNTISITQDGDYMAFGGDDDKIYIWDMSTEGSEFLTQTLIESLGADITASDFSDDSQYLLVGNSRGMLYMYKRICAGCPIGTYSNLSVCTPCTQAIPGCYSCDNSSYCRICSNGYYLDTSNNKCESCVQSITGCNQCNTSAICTSCVQKYYLDTGSNTCKTCWSASTGCNACNASNNCFTCDYRYYLNSSSKACVSCTNITNCLSCNSSVYCLQCIQGYYQDGSGGCTRCNVNCTMCTNASYCTQCDNGFYLASGVCSPCTVKGCLSCNSTNSCFDCLQSMFVNSGSCSFCTPPCSQCQTTASTCLSCVGGYYLSGSSCLTCTSITIGCLSCNGSTSTRCLSCQVGYYLNSTNGCSQCTSLLANCAQCTNSSCTVCQMGYYYNTTDSDCKICKKGCFTCTSQAVCQSCQVGYYFTSGTNSCSICPTPCSACNSSLICTSCNPRYYFNSTNNNCTICGVSKCDLCSSQSVCTSCFEGFFVDSAGALCRSCSVNITNCLSCYNQSYCKSCAIGFYLTVTNAACTECASPCSACNSTDCHNCELGYYLTTTTPKSCIVCPSACAICVSATNCSSCVTGYYLNSGTNVCVNCSSITAGCSKCTSTDCLDCQAGLGYYFVGANSPCGSCSTVIPNCIYCLDSTICNICEYGYILAISNTTCQKCPVANCEDCLSSTACLTCMKGFYADPSGVCKLCMQGCFSCNASNYCEICVRDYVLETNNTCTICQTKVQGCQMCNYSPTIKCTNCLSGYYLSGTTCSLCSSSMSGCSICNSSGVCIGCLAQYFMFTDDNCHLCSNNISSCQLCLYDTVNSVLNCTECNEGFFLNSTKLCQQCPITGCLGCTNSATCTRCQTGYYLNGVTCTQCQITYTGCLLCNTSSCIQCVSGYYLSGGICSACTQVGCQICSQTSPTTRCLSCNSAYYLTAVSACQTCSTPLPNCLECTTALSCQQCQSGYFVSGSGTCKLCSQPFPGCIKCNPTNCIQCDSGYLLNSSNLCQLCNNLMPGCSFCLSPTNCIACQSGYYMNSGSTCNLCSDIQGCLQCQDSTTCIFCDYGYYINGGTCNLCNQTIQNCVACTSPVICTACQGNFDLSGGSCTQIQGLAIANYTNIKFITQFVSKTQLKSSLISIGQKLYEIQLDWSALTKLYILDKQFTKYPLTIKSWSFGDDGYSLVFVTDNPLGNSDIFESLSDMPFLSRRVLMIQQEQIGRVLQSSFTGTLNSQIQMTQSGINSLFPSIHHTGSFYTLYDLQSPQFYKSILKNKSYIYHYFGFGISALLILVYYLKSVITVPESNDKGQIIPHILCVKIVGLILYPIYGEQLDYCLGFMLLDFPWLNELFSYYLSVPTDITPAPYQMYYPNMNLASTFLMALAIIFFIYIIFYAYFKVFQDSQDDWNSFQSYLYNLFIVGLLVASFGSLQGAYLNPILDISISSMFYILGISIYIGLLLQTAYSLYNFKKYMPFHKPRVIFKVTLLCLAYNNPLYIFMAMMFLQFCMLIIEYIIKKETLIRPKTWLCNNILADIALGLMMLGPQSLLFLYAASALIVLVIGIDIYIQIKQYSQFEQINKVKIRQKELVKTMESFEFQNKQTRMKNDQIYFKNRVMEQLSVTNQNITNTQTKNDFYKTNESLLFNEEQSDNNSNFFQTLTPLQSLSPDKHRMNRRKPHAQQKDKPKGKGSNLLLSRRKKQDDDFLNEDNQETFILGQL